MVKKEFDPTTCESAGGVPASAGSSHPANSRKWWGDPEDPMEMVGVELSGQGEAEVRDMALCYAEEFARDGWSAEKLMAMFMNPYYQGPYLVWRQKGDAFVLSVVQEALKMWQGVRHKVSADSFCCEKGDKV